MLLWIKSTLLIPVNMEAAAESGAFYFAVASEYSIKNIRSCLGEIR